jgi:hypothetical protein
MFDVRALSVCPRDQMRSVICFSYWICAGTPSKRGITASAEAEPRASEKFPWDGKDDENGLDKKSNISIKLLNP